MGPLPFIIGAGIVALVTAAAAKSKAKTTATATTATGTTTTTKPSTTTSTVPASTAGQVATSQATGWLESVPYVIALRVIALQDPSVQQAQAVWLNDNGYPQTAEGIRKYSAGDINETELLAIAKAEFSAKTGGATTTTATATKPKGTTEMDRYGAYLLTQDDLDTLYSYALTSTSIPLVSQAAVKLATFGDTRAANLTQHLAELTT